jgi:hypothetical protein
VKFEKEPEPPFYVAVRFGRLRDRSIGQMEEIQALLDILKATEDIMKLTNEVFIRAAKKQKLMSPQSVQQAAMEIVIKVEDGLTRFMEAKTNRVARLLEYFRLDNRDMTDQVQKFKELEILWDDLKQEYRCIISEFMGRPTSQYSTNTLDELKIFQDLISNKSVSLMRRIKEIEDTMQKDIIWQIASFTKTNMPMDSNALYKLLTDEP